MPHNGQLTSQKRFSQVGFSRLIRLEWLERTANLVLAGNDESSIYDALQRFLDNKLYGGKNVKGGSREKTIAILRKIWVRPPIDLICLRDNGLEILSHIPREEHVIIHWGMTMAAYPFWSAVAMHIGRQLKLQGTTSVGQVQRRISEQYGERGAVSLAVQKIFLSLADWGLLRRTANRGIYVPGLSFAIIDIRIIAWLVEAFLHVHQGGPLMLDTIFNLPSLFPFRINPVSSGQLVKASERLDAFSVGIGQDFLVIGKAN